MRDRLRRDHGRAMRNRRRYYRIKEHREAMKLRRLAAIAAAIGTDSQAGQVRDTPPDFG